MYVIIPGITNVDSTKFDRGKFIILSNEEEDASEWLLLFVVVEAFPSSLIVNDDGEEGPSVLTISAPNRSSFNAVANNSAVMIDGS